MCNARETSNQHCKITKTIQNLKTLLFICCCCCFFFFITESNDLIIDKQARLLQSSQIVIIISLLCKKNTFNTITEHCHTKKNFIIIRTDIQIFSLFRLNKCNKVGILHNYHDIIFVITQRIL